MQVEAGSEDEIEIEGNGVVTSVANTVGREVEEINAVDQGMQTSIV